MNPQQLRTMIADLAACEAEGLLSEVQMAFAHACRLKSGGRPNDGDRTTIVEHMNAADTVRAKLLAKAAADMSGHTQLECERRSLGKP